MTGARPTPTPAHRFTQRARRPTSGMTLVEVLVALAVFAIIGVAAFSMLDQTLRSERIADARLDRLNHLQRLMEVVTLDTLQTVAGSVARDDTGISFLRRGTASSGLVVRYAVQAGAFVREIGAQGADPARQVLLSDVQSASWRFVQGGAVLPPDAPLEATEGVELVLTLADSQTLRSVFPVPHDVILPVSP